MIKTKDMMLRQRRAVSSPESAKDSSNIITSSQWTQPRHVKDRHDSRS
jgi:hypothetical protein